MKKLKKVAICLMMSLTVLAASFASTGVTAQAASPYWGAAYLDAGASTVTIYINDVKGPITSATIKSWDFSLANGTLGVDIRDPSNQSHGFPIMFDFNKTVSGRLGTVSKESGTYKIVVNVLAGNHSGGWVGCWLY